MEVLSPVGKEGRGGGDQKRENVRCVLVFSDAIFCDTAPCILPRRLSSQQSSRRSVKLQDASSEL